jgi:hypothetical protein
MNRKHFPSPHPPPSTLAVLEIELRALYLLSRPLHQHFLLWLVGWLVSYGGNEVWMQGFTPAKQVLYHLSHISTNYLPGLVSNHDLPNISFPCSQDYRSEPPAARLFWDRVSLYPQDGLDYNPICTAWGDRCAAIVWDRASQTFCPGWPQTKMLPISISWVAGITDLSITPGLRKKKLKQLEKEKLTVHKGTNMTAFSLEIMQA